MFWALAPIAKEDKTMISVIIFLILNFLAIQNINQSFIQSIIHSIINSIINSIIH